MFKATILSLAIAGSLFAASAAAQASPSAADCQYARTQLSQGAGFSSDNSNYNSNAVLLQQCR